jgi:hypothetical protein
MDKKEELLQLIAQLEIDIDNYKSLKKYQIPAILLFFIGGFVLFLILMQKRKKLNTRKQVIVKLLNSLNDEIPLEEYLALFDKVLKIYR